MQQHMKEANFVKMKYQTQINKFDTADKFWQRAYILNKSFMFMLFVCVEFCFYFLPNDWPKINTRKYRRKELGHVAGRHSIDGIEADDEFCLFFFSFLIALFSEGGDVSKIATLIWRTFLFHLDRLVAFLLNFVLFLPLCVCDFIIIVCNTYVRWCCWQSRW